MLELYVSSLITFFVGIDPPGCAPIYAGLTGALWFRPGVLALEFVIYLVKNIKLRRPKEPLDSEESKRLAPGPAGDRSDP